MTEHHATGPDVTVIEAAHQYADLGLRVIPIKPGKKYPAINEWQNAATTDPATIDAWWGGLYRGWGVGIVTGPDSGVWALDIDVANGKSGMGSLRALCEAYGNLPKTARARTPSGGMHVLFRWDDEHPVSNIQSNTTLLGPGLDIRGAGGQILAAPTLHPNGAPYAWIDHPATTPILDAPPWLYALLERDDDPAPFDGPADIIPRPVADHRDDSDSAAGRIGEFHNFVELLLADGWTRYKDGSDELWTRPGKDRRDGLSARLFDGQGPLVVFSSEAPAAVRAAGIPTKGNVAVSLGLFGYVAATRFDGDRSACARDIRQRINGSSSTPVDWSLDIEQFRDAIAAEPAAGAPPAAEPAVDGDPDNRLRAHVYTTAQLGQRTPPEPLIEGWLFRNSLAFLVGPPKSGKTFIAIDIAMSVATGVEWVGGTATRPGKVLYILGEGVSGVFSRIVAWREAREVDAADRIAWIDRAVQLKNADDIRDLLGVCVDHRPDLIVVDTFARGAVGIEENSAKEVGEAIAGLDAIKAATGACVLVIHHTGKDSDKGARGSSAFAGAWDSAIRIKGDTRSVMTVVNDQQKDVEDGHEFAVRFDRVAGSIAPRRTDEAPSVDDDGGRISALTKARMSFLSAGRRYRGREPLTFTGWRDRASGAGRLADLRPAFMTLVDDGYFVADGTVVNRGRDIELYRFLDPED